MAGLKAVPLDIWHFVQPARLGDSVSINYVPKFKVRRDGRMRRRTSRSVSYMVTSLSPLLAVPVSATFVKHDFDGTPIAVKTRRFAHG